MNVRAIALILLSSLFMILLINNSQRQQPLDPETVASQQQEDADSRAAVNGVANSDSADDPGQPSGTLLEADLTSTSPDGADDTDDTAAEPQTAPDTPDGQTLAANRPQNSRLYSIGSLAADSPCRYLMTVNSKGGTVRRVELNFREAGRDRFAYRELEFDGGYLGSLDCIDTRQGCEIRNVGQGTAAFNARCPQVTGGLKAGDLIMAADGEPIVTSSDLDQWLSERTKPGSQIELSIMRSIEGTPTNLRFTANLSHKPIELVRPEQNPYFPDFNFPESFSFRLLEPKGIHDDFWPELDRQMATGDWELESIDDQHVALKFVLDPQTLKKAGFEPLAVVKTFRLPRVNAEDQHRLDSRTFHYEIDLQIINLSDQTQKVAYQLDGPSGSPIETWWYTHKIHGRSTAIGYAAGARDVIGSTAAESFIFKGCPEIAQGAVAKIPFALFISNPRVDNPLARHLNYVGVDTLYFNNTLIPHLAEGEIYEVNSVTAFPNGPVPPNDQKKYHRLVDASFQLFRTVELEPNGIYQQTFDVFSGPKENPLLNQYGLDDVRTFGWFAWFSKPLLSILHFFYWITGGISYGLAIVMLTVLVRSLMIPISRKAALNAQMMQHLQPQMTEIREKYKDNFEKQGLAQRELFKKYKYNPLGGCFMIFLQLPIFLGLFRGLSVDIALRDQPLIPGVSWCGNLAGPDKLLYWRDWTPGFLTDEIGFLGPYLNILPLITVVFFLVQQKLFMPPPTDDQQRLMQKMMTFMMMFMGILFFKVAAGLCIYFITSSVWSIVEKLLLPKPQLDVGRVEGLAEKRLKGKSSNADSSHESTLVQQAADLAARKKEISDRKKKLKNRNR